jgi:hypothetical protein
MKLYEIPFTYTVNASIKIEASDLDSAITKALNLAEVNDDGSCRLIHGYSPIIKSEIEVGSIRIDRDEAEERNPKKSYTVKLVRTQTVEVEVEAHSAEEAEQVAIEGAEDGSLDDFSNCIEEEIVAEEIEEN